MPKVQIPASVIKDIVDRNAHKLVSKEKLDGISNLCKFEMIKTEAQRKKRLEQMDMFDRLQLQKEYTLNLIQIKSLIQKNLEG